MFYVIFESVYFYDNQSMLASSTLWIYTMYTSDNRFLIKELFLWTHIFIRNLRKHVRPFKDYFAFIND